jgi:NAD(P)-dependent dehydrogenase (short-subunit alcohol dehydrogenase family)
MKVLVLGGTVFFGRHLVAALIANGHRVTTFNRVTHRDVDACRTDAAAASNARWVDGAFLAERGCAGWSDVPLWVRPDTPFSGIFGVDVTRALDAGLRLRPLEETVRATRAWYAQTGRTGLAAGLDSNREMELLDAWNAAISS